MSEINNSSRIGVYIGDDLLARCDAAMQKTNAESRSEFIRDAIEHYIAVLNMKENSRVLTPALESVMPDDKLYSRLGSMNLHGIGTEKNLELAREYLNKAAIMGNVDAVYGMGKLYLESDVQKAIAMFELAAEQGNTYAEYQLGKIYCFGQGVPQNLEVGMDWLKASASHGNEYAAQLLEKVQNHVHRQTTSAMFGLFRGLAGMIQSSAKQHIYQRNIIDSKQRKKIQEKKQAHGQRSSSYEYDYSEGQTM